MSRKELDKIMAYILPVLAGFLIGVLVWEAIRRGKFGGTAEPNAPFWFFAVIGVGLGLAYTLKNRKELSEL